jgi:hypothetical protein
MMITALALKEEIHSRSNSRKQATLDALWQVLEDMRRKRVKSFTLAQVGRHAEAAGVLKTQTLRNAGGEDYRALIDAFAQEIGVATTTLPSTKPTPLEEAIDAMPDLDTRTRLRMVLVENNRQREEISRLRQAFKHMQNNLSSIQVDTPTPEIVPASRGYPDLVPMDKFLSTEWVDERRWTLEANGAIYDESGECIAPVGFTTALSSTLKLFRRKTMSQDSEC